MPGLGMDQHTKRRSAERRSRRRRNGTAEDLRYSVMRVRAAMRNSPTQILRSDDTKALAAIDRKELQNAGYATRGDRFLRLPLEAARRALGTLRDLW